MDEGLGVAERTRDQSGGGGFHITTGAGGGRWYTTSDVPWEAQENLTLTVNVMWLIFCFL